MIVFNLINTAFENFPPRLRKHFSLALLRSLIAPIEHLYISFYDFFAKVKYELIFDGTVIYFEHVLNDTFDVANRAIYIDDAIDSVPVVLYNMAENNENTYLYNIAENESAPILFNGSETYADFTVMVPQSLVFNQDQMIALVRKYKIAGKKFTIQTF